MPLKAISFAWALVNWAIGPEGLKKAAASLGLKAESKQLDKDALAHLPCPAIAWWEGNHYVLVLAVAQSPLTGEVSATIHDPNAKEKQTIALADLLARSGGIVLTLKK